MNNDQKEQKKDEGRNDDKKSAPKIKVSADGDSEAEVSIKGSDDAADVLISGEKINLGANANSQALDDSNGVRENHFKEKNTSETGFESSKEDEEDFKETKKRHNEAKTAASGDGHKQHAKSESVLEEKDSSEKFKSELDSKDQQLRKVQQSLLESELKILKLEGEIQRLNDQYTKKVTEKALEAQKLVDKRLAELQAEFTAKAADAKKYALTSGAARLAELLQNFEMVLSTSQKAGEAVKNYSQGFVMVFEMMNKTLGELGITPIEVNLGDNFDHDTMEIFEGVDTKDFKHNQVVEVLKKGYRLHDKVIAHAIVKVAN